MFEEGPRKSPLKGSRKETDLWEGSTEDLKEGPAEASRDGSVVWNLCGGSCGGRYSEGSSGESQ